MIKRFFIIVMAVSFLSCDKESEIDKEQILQIRENAVETLTIGSNSFVLDAYLWRLLPFHRRLQQGARTFYRVFHDRYNMTPTDYRKSKSTKFI